MPTRITQFEDHQKKRVTLRIEGSVSLIDAELIERLCTELHAHFGYAVTLDLADLSFLDSDSAHILCRLRADHGVSIEGLHLFIQRVIEMAEQDEQSCGSVLYRGRRRGL